MTAVSVDSVLAFGFVLGLRHATDADHLAAISTIVTERRSLPNSLLIGASWGFGHTIALLIAGVGVLLLRYQLTDRTTDALELGVGIMLVLLGANVLRGLACASGQARGGPAAAHSHADVWVVARPLCIGLVHGLAGSAPLLLLTVTVLSSPIAAFSYLAVFGVGTMMGMAIMSVVVSVPTRLAGTRFAHSELALRGLSGVFSVGLGIVIVYQNGVLNRLFAT
jgi:high-affinity nickel-transport protein